ncbi:ATP-binding protein [Hydrogenophaga atypica]|uniref:histidine kinase n=1 Tax=Hydrogenophaga atypica TaxID=249409 RepID=A0ABW2QP77_9BURK
MELKKDAPSGAPAHSLRRRASDMARLGPLRRYTYEVMAAAAVLPFLVAWLATQNGLWHANALAHDQWLAHDAPPTWAEVVVIALDETCPAHLIHCAALPMRRLELMERLKPHGPRSVIMDIPSMPDTATLPADRDGIVRRLLPHAPGANTTTVHHAMQVLRLAPPRDGWPSELFLRWRATDQGPPVWTYADVLMDKLPPHALRNKLVVVGPRGGAQAGPPLLVRVGASTHTLPQPDAYAQVLDNLQHGRWVRHLPAGAALLWAALPLWLAAWLCLRRPEHTAQVVMSMGLATTTLSAYTLLQHGWWLPAATPLAGLVLFLLVCSWRRSQALSALFAHRIERLDKVLAQSPMDADPRLQPLAPQVMDRAPQAKVEVLDQALERLEAQHQIQRRLHQQRDRWLAFLSHDLRAPQSNILSLLELREHGVEGMTDERFYGGIRVQVDRTLRLAEGFVDLLRAESDTLNRRHGTLEHLAQEAVDRCWPQAQAAQVKIVQRGTSNEDGAFYGDPELLTRAMVNMLGNALRHSEPGSQVEVCVARDPHTHQVAWSVRDHGAGMEAQALADLLHALDTHTWVRPRGKTGGARTHGLGLGLLVAHTVVARHGGELHALAAPGEGCHFLMLLPPPDSGQAAPPPHHSSPTLSPENPRGATHALPA